MRICYFGIYNPDFSRNKIYISGLKQNGVEVLECRDDSKGLHKFWRLWRKHRKIKNDYDVLIVGYPGHIVVWFARLLSSKPIIADLLGSLEDAEVHSHHPSFYKRLKAKIADLLGVKFADLVLLESEAQKDFFEEKFGKSNKFKVVYTGASFEWERNTEVPKHDFIVVFRGRLSPESGIGYVLEAANILKNESQIKFRIIGGGGMVKKVQAQIQNLCLSNVELFHEYLDLETMIKLSGEASLFLGQFEDNPRLNRTIPHKAFEALALGVPYLSGDAKGAKEVYEESKTGYFVPLADPQALATKIREIFSNKNILKEMSQQQRKIFNQNFSSHVLGRVLIGLIKTYI